MGRIKQFTETYRIASQTDKRLGLYTLLAFLLGAAVGAGLLWLLPPNDGGVIKIILTVVGGLLFGAMSALLLFSRRAQKAAYAQMEGRPGAAIAALSTLKRGWHTDKLVAFNKQQDMVHRVVGRPGIVLIGEGNPNRLRTMLANERRKHERVAADVPVHEVIVGNDEGQVPLPKLTRSVQRLPKAVKPAEMTDILARLKALDANRSTIPMPKGPVPTSMKGLRGNMRGR
jgi:hypothetical protein